MSDSSDSDDMPLVAAAIGEDTDSGDDTASSATIASDVLLEVTTSQGDAKAAAVTDEPAMTSTAKGKRTQQPKRAQPKAAGECKAPKAPKTAKKVKLTQEDVTASVAAWFTRENKPAIAVSLVAALGSKMSKGMIQKALDDLLAQGTIVTKEIKKAVVYYPCQAQFASVSLEDSLRLKLRCDESVAKNAELDAEFRELNARKLQLSAIVSIAQLRQEVATTSDAVAVLALRVGGTDAAAAAAASSRVVSRDDMVKACHYFQAMKKLWLERQRLCRDMIESFAVDKRPADVIAELDLEVDPTCVVVAINGARIPHGLI